VKIVRIVRWRLRRYVQNTPPEMLYRQSLYWGVIAIFSLIILLTSYHIQTIPEKIARAAHATLHHRPWVREFVVVDGRHIYLRGEIEPDSGIEHEMGLLKKVTGVIRVTDRLSENPRPSVHLQIKKLPDELILSGRLPGDLLETVIADLKNSFPDITIRDGIRIDDRLGRPLWIDGFDRSLDPLKSLQRFDFNGWRNEIFLTGTADSEFKGRQIGYTVPASLISDVTVTHRLTPPTAPTLSPLIIVADWSGTWIKGSVASQPPMNQLLDTVKFTFGTAQIHDQLEVDASLSDTKLLELMKLLPSLGDVRDLRLESSGNHYIVWGQVDNPFQLGAILQHRNATGLEALVRNEIRVSKADKSASMTLFSDGDSAVLSGRLPTWKSHKNIIEQINNLLGVEEIKDLTSIEPNIAHSEWLGKWPNLLGTLPTGAVGVTIDERSILLTGNVDTDRQWRRLNHNIEKLFPNQNRRNWITIGL